MITLPLASTLSTCGSILPVGERCSAWVVVWRGAANGSQSSSPEGLGAFDSEGDGIAVLVADRDVEEAGDPDSETGRTSDSYSPLANSAPGEAGNSP